MTDAIPRCRLTLGEIGLWMVPIALCLVGLRDTEPGSALPLVSAMGLAVIAGFVVVLHFCRELNAVVFSLLVIVSITLIRMAMAIVLGV